MKKILKKIFKNELIAYIFWGVTTTLVNLGTYTILGHIMDYKVANFIAIIVGKIYAYFVNKFFVFRSSCRNMKELLEEILAYILVRGFSGVVDFAGVIFLVEVLSIGQNVAKYIVTVVVMVLNYVLGKWAVFRKHN